MGNIGVPELMIVLVFMGLFWLLMIWPAARICKRVGMSPWLGVLIIIPIGNVIYLWVVAMSRWPRVQADPNAPSVDVAV